MQAINHETVCGPQVLAILIVQAIVGYFAMKRTQTTGMGWFILSLFPLSIIFIAALEAAGFD